MRQRRGNAVRMTMVAALTLTGITGATVMRGGVAGAAIKGSCGNIIRIPTPRDARQGAHEAQDLAFVFPERQGLKLASALTVEATKVGLYDAPSKLPTPSPKIKAGTVVDSYSIQSDPPKQPQPPVRPFSASITFDSKILGIIVRTGPLLSTDPIVGAPQTTYAVASNRGLELGSNFDAVRIVNSYTIRVRFTTSTFIDNLRVIVAHSSVRSGMGYSVSSPGGRVRSFGARGYFGSLGTAPKGAIVGGALTCTGGGYWLTGRDGAVYRFGDAAPYGSMAGRPLTRPVVAMAATPTGKGYWLVASDGGMFSFGDAHFYGSMGGKPLWQPVVGLSPTASGKGYWQVASDGGIFTFGDAHFYGSMGGKPLDRPIIGILTTPSGRGYWMFASDGGIFTFGNARFFGSLGGRALPAPITSVKITPSGQGYWMLDTAGRVYAFGDAKNLGSATSLGAASVIF